MYNGNCNNNNCGNGSGGICKTNTPAPVYPWSVDSVEKNTNASTTSTLLSVRRIANNNNIINVNNNVNFNICNNNITTNNLMDSIIGSKTITNYNSRIQTRLAASMAGLKELDNLREKHRRLVQEVKNIISFPSAELSGISTNCCNENQIRSPSPAPSAAELSSNISHRSSLSMDSGCLSLASEFSHQYTLSADSTNNGYFSLPPSRKNSNSTCSTGYQPAVSALLTSGHLSQHVNHSALVDQSDDEGCFVEHQHPAFTLNNINNNNLKRDIYGSTLSVATSEYVPINVPQIATMPKFGYRRRGLLHNRPKSLYSYPEENTVLVNNTNDEDQESKPSYATLHCNAERPRINRASSVQWTPSFQSTGRFRPQPSPSSTSTGSNAVYRANRVYINAADVQTSSTSSAHQLPHSISAGSLKFSTNNLRPIRSRPTSIAMPSYHTPSASMVDNFLRNENINTINRRQSSASNCSSFTWDQVKRMLDPAFDSRSTISSTPTMVRHRSSVGINHHRSVSDIFSTADNFRNDYNNNSNENRKSDRSNSSTIGRHDHCGGRCSSSTTSEHSGGGHVIVSRSVSSQSTDSNKSSRKKEKPWRESEQL